MEVNPHVSIRDAGLRGTEPLSIKTLSGFDRRFHHLPDAVSRSAEAFVIQIAQQDLARELTDTYTGLQQRFKYKRKALTTALVDGRGSVVTPDFEYHVSIAQDSTDGSRAIWTREVTNISNPDVISTIGFDDVFEGRFNAVCATFSERLNITELIDRIEEEEPDGFELEYPPDFSYCVIRLRSLPGILRITEHALAYELLAEKSPSRLIKSFIELMQSVAVSGSMAGLLPRKPQ